MLSYGALQILHVSEDVLKLIFSGQVRFLGLPLGRHVSYLDSLLFLACSFDFKFFDSSHDVIE